MSAATDPRWYVLNSMHMATLCAGKEDAEAAAAEYDLQYPLRAPHRAVQLVEVSPPLAVSMSDVDQAQLAAMLAQAPAMPLVAALDESKLAACFDQIKSDLIADGAVEHDLRLEFFPEAVLDAFRRQRAARQEAQQRLADMRELMSKSGLAHRKAVQVAVSEAVAAEREACAEIAADSDHIVDVPGHYAQLGDAKATAHNIEKAIRARGAA